ncbi:MAG: radical SAM protein [Pseudomonadales bacterium]|nr:radical SAM protein [Pseudomonadales bacterium]
MNVEKTPKHIIRAVVDTLQECNLRCQYCHPGHTWEKKHLSANLIEQTLSEAEQRGLLEVTLTGGEITLHPELVKILESTQVLDRTVSTLITNGTTMTPELARQFRDSNVSRICTSIDGPDAGTHNTYRGNSFDRAINGLRLLQETGKPITVITVAHHKNYEHVLELSNLLAKEGLAAEHHICAPSYSGTAKDNYEEFRLRQEEFFALQQMVDDSYQDLKNQGLFVTFNSFWPATGERAKTNNSRTITLVQLTEQLKDCYIIVRPNGDVRLTAAAWGRETIGNAVTGNLHTDSVKIALNQAEQIYNQGLVKQLPREIEAVHKFHYGKDVNPAITNKILSDKESGAGLVQMVPIKPLSESDLFQIPLSEEQMLSIASNLQMQPDRYRLVNIAGNSYVLFDRLTTHITLLKPEEVLMIVGLGSH